MSDLELESVVLSTGETLTFEPKAHVYEIDGKQCPGTHALMEPSGIVKPLNQFTEPYARRGERIHLITQFYDEGDLDESSVDSSERGYLDAWIKFKGEIGIVIEKGGVERLNGSVPYWFATKTDRVATVDGKGLIVNIKTGNAYPKPHSAALHLESMLYPDAELLWAVRLDPSGEYHVDDYSDDDEARKLARAIVQANGLAHHYMTTRRKPTKALKV